MGADPVRSADPMKAFKIDALTDVSASSETSEETVSERGSQVMNARAK